MATNKLLTVGTVPAPLALLAQRLVAVKAGRLPPDQLTEQVGAPTGNITLPDARAGALTLLGHLNMESCRDCEASLRSNLTGQIEGASFT